MAKLTHDAGREIEAVTFDFFGTLVFHREGRGRGRVLTEYLEAHGFGPPPWEHEVLYDVFESHGDRYSPSAPAGERNRYRAEIASRVFSRLRIDASPEERASHADALWRVLGPDAFEVFPDVRDALERLRAAGLPLAIVSNWQSGLGHFCEELGIAASFDHILGSADLGVAKPDERMFLAACDRLGVPPERTLHVGDSIADDCEGGEAAGLQTVLIDRGATTAPGTHRVVRSLAELAV